MQNVVQDVIDPPIRTVFMYFLNVIKEAGVFILLLLFLGLVILVIYFNKKIRRALGDATKFFSYTWNTLALGIQEAEFQVDIKGNIGGNKVTTSKKIVQKFEPPDSTALSVIAKKLAVKMTGDKKKKRKKRTD